MPAPRKVTLQQILKLIEQVEKFKTIELGLPIYSDKRRETFWPEIAKIVNRIPGEFKSSSGWRRYWVEIKSRTRKKAATGKRKILPHEKRILELSGRAEEKDQSKNFKSEPLEVLIEERLEDDGDSSAEYLETPGSPASDDHKYTNQHQDPVSTMEDCNGDHSEVHEHDEEEGTRRIEKSIKREDDVPNWVQQVERRRLALEERTTRAIEKMSNGIIAISGSMEMMSQAMVSLVDSMKKLEESLRPETSKK